MEFKGDSTQADKIIRPDEPSWRDSRPMRGPLDLEAIAQNCKRFAQTPEGRDSIRRLHEIRNREIGFWQRLKEFFFGR